MVNAIRRGFLLALVAAISVLGAAGGTDPRTGGDPAAPDRGAAVESAADASTARRNDASKNESDEPGSPRVDEPNHAISSRGPVRPAAPDAPSAWTPGSAAPRPPVRAPDLPAQDPARSRGVSPAAPLALRI